MKIQKFLTKHKLNCATVHFAVLWASSLSMFYRIKLQESPRVKPILVLIASLAVTPEHIYQLISSVGASICIHFFENLKVNYCSKKNLIYVLRRKYLKPRGDL